MRLETDLEKVKEVSRILLMTDVHLTEFSPMIVQHPFTQSGIVGMQTKEGTYLIDITESRENLSKWQKFVSQQIDAMETVNGIYMIVNKPYALTFLRYVAPHLSKSDYSTILADAWIRSENPNSDANVSRQKLVSMFKDADPTVLMDADELKEYRGLPDRVTIYRGVTSYNGKNIKALSWTLDYDKAAWFAHRFGEEGTVYEAQIAQPHVLAYFGRRNEAEVIVDPRYLEGIQEVPEMGMSL